MDVNMPILLEHERIRVFDQNKYKGKLSNKFNSN